MLIAGVVVAIRLRSRFAVTVSSGVFARMALCLGVIAFVRVTFAAGTELTLWGVTTRALLGLAEPPKCVTVYPPPGMGWQEATARVTGARVDRIKAGEPVKAGTRSLLLQVVDEPGQVLVKLGEC